MSRSVFAERDFRLVLIAWGVSMVGDFMAVIALTLRVEAAVELLGAAAPSVSPAPVR